MANPCVLAPSGLAPSPTNATAPLHDAMPSVQSRRSIFARSSRASKEAASPSSTLFSYHFWISFLFYFLGQEDNINRTPAIYRIFNLFRQTETKHRALDSLPITAIHPATSSWTRSISSSINRKPWHLLGVTAPVSCCSSSCVSSSAFTSGHTPSQCPFCHSRPPSFSRRRMMITASMASFRLRRTSSASVLILGYARNRRDYPCPLLSNRLSLYSTLSAT